MNQKKELDNSLKLIVKSSFIVFIGIVFSKIFTYIYRVITARILGPEIYGLFSLALMSAGFFIAFFSLGLQNGLLRYISYYRGKKQKNKIQYLSQFSIKFVLITSILGAILLFSFSETISIKLFNNPDLIIFLKWFAVFIPISIFAGLFHSIIRAYEKIKWYSLIGNIIYPGTQLISLVLLIILGFKSYAVIFSHNLGFLAIFITAILICKYKTEIFNKPNLKNKQKILLRKKLFSYSWPIMFIGIVMALFSWIDSFSIGFFNEVSDVGIYNVAIPIAFLLLIIPELFIQLFFPLITREYSQEKIEVIKDLSKQVGKWILTINLPIFIVLVLFPGAVINILFGPQYIQAETSLRLLSIGVFIYSVFIISENLLSMAGKSKIMLFNLIMASVLNFILNIILVPIYGINGAAFSTMISYIIFGLLSFFQAKYFTSITPLKRAMIKIALISIIPSILLLYFRRIVPINLFSLIIQGSLFLLLYFFLILITKGFDKNDFLILKTIKNRIF